MACLSRSFTSAGAVPPMSTPGSSLKPWKATAWAKRRDITELSSGKQTGLRSVEVMCQRTKAPPPRPPALAPPRAGQLRAEALGHPLGLLVGVLLDVATVGGDGDEVRLRAVVVQPLDQLTGISGLLVAQVRIDDLRVQHTLELLLRLEPLPAAETHAHDRVRRLVQQLAHGVERELAVAMDPHLLARPAAEGRQRSRRRGAVLAAVLEIRPGCRTPS